MSLYRLPIFPLCLALIALGMLAPAAYALLEGDWGSMGSFLYAAVFTGFAAATLGVALGGRPPGRAARSELFQLIVCWALVPLFAAAPVWLITPYTGFGGAWFEMVSAFTTTGGTVYSEPETVPGAVHLWRGLVAWLGGLVTLAAAFAILAPRNLGGFEVAGGGRGALPVDRSAVGGSVLHEEAMAPLNERLARALHTVLPVYLTLTAVLGFLFAALGQGNLAAAVHAMAIISTSGVSPHAAGIAAQPSFVVELTAALFMVLAATRLTFAETRRAAEIGHWHRDPELRLMALLVAAATLALFLRHWFGALEVARGGEAAGGFPALWGAFFTSLSFLTTTGFESASWRTAQDWSGLENPGLILLGLCAIGGGAATTAGGIKLIRACALLQHGRRELERLAQPYSVVATGRRLSGILHEVAFLAWASIMLFTMAIFAAVVGLTVTGQTFQVALVGAIAAISNTGPAFAMVAPGDIDFSRLGGPERAVLGVTMILGRLETLAVISLFGAVTWPRPRSRELPRQKMLEKRLPKPQSPHR
ncbi:MAG TPA: potassium transporter TrkG [Thermohalobaculum sp.]|nr:potassium transporter TrkG [Thermohalobaculum sp.]